MCNPAKGFRGEAPQPSACVRRPPAAMQRRNFQNGHHVQNLVAREVCREEGDALKIKAEDHHMPGYQREGMLRALTVSALQIATTAAGAWQFRGTALQKGEL